MKKIIKPFIPSFLWRIRRKFYDYLEDQRFKKICQTRKVGCSAGAIKNFTNLEQASRIKVLFYNDWGGSWEALEPLALALSKNEDFEVIVLAMPTLVQSGDFYDLGATKALQEFSKKIHIPITYTLDVNARVQCVVGFDSQMQVTLYPETTQAHYCFTTRPYDSLRPHGWSNADIAECMKLCRVEYGMLFVALHLDFLYDCPNAPWYHRANRCYDFLFLPDIFHRDIMVSCKDKSAYTNFVVTGSPRLETFRQGDFSKPHTEKLTLFYTSRYAKGDPYGTFFTFIEYFMQLANEDKINFIYRPHPNMCDTKPGNHNILNETQWRDFVARFDAPNLYLDTNPSYHDSFQKADVIISDASSTIVYAFLANKPVIYTQNLVGGELNGWAVKILQGCFIVDTLDSMRELIVELQNDFHGTLAPLLCRREKILKECFYFPPEGSMQRVTDTLMADYRNIISHASAKSLPKTKSSCT